MVGYHELHDIVRDTLFHGGGEEAVSFPLLGSENMGSGLRTVDVIGIKSPHERRGFPFERVVDLLDNLLLEEKDVELHCRGYGSDREEIFASVRRAAWDRGLRPALNWWIAWTNSIQHDRGNPAVLWEPHGSAHNRPRPGSVSLDIITDSFIVLVLPPIVELGEEVPNFVGRDW